jgi:VWFA-related protein
MNERRFLLAVLGIALAMPLAIEAGGPGKEFRFGQQRPEPDPRPFLFRSGIELINVTATVTDARGRVVSGLTQDDFTVYEDGNPVRITHFLNQRIPVSLGIALDTSGSMEGRKMDAARNALNHFIYDLLGPDDEIFLYRFDYTPVLTQNWTTNRDQLSLAIQNLRPRGGTAMYDAVAESLPRLADGQQRKKALLLISDGHDTNSETDLRELRSLIRNSEALIYAIGIDGRSQRPAWRGQNSAVPPPTPRRFPFPVNGQPTTRFPLGRNLPPARSEDKVNITALRALTDSSGGWTEIIWNTDDLEPVTASIANELNQQYYLGYPASSEKDGQWHAIRIEVRNSEYRVRARRGYIASP